MRFITAILILVLWGCTSQIEDCSEIPDKEAFSTMPPEEAFRILSKVGKELAYGPCLDRPRSIELINKAIGLEVDTLSKVRLLEQQMKNYYASGEFEKSLVLNLKIRDYFPKDQPVYGWILYDIGNKYQNTSYSMAKVYWDSAYSLAVELDDAELVARIYQEHANMLIELKKLDTAKRFLDLIDLQAIKDEMDEEEFLEMEAYNLSLQGEVEAPNDFFAFNNYFAQSISNLLEIQFYEEYANTLNIYVSNVLDHYPEKKDLILDSLNAIDLSKLDDPVLIDEIVQSFGRYYTSIEKYDTAFSLLQRAERTFERNRMYGELLSVYEPLAICAEKLGRDEVASGYREKQEALQSAIDEEYEKIRPKIIDVLLNPYVAGSIGLVVAFSVFGLLRRRKKDQVSQIREIIENELDSPSEDVLEIYTFAPSKVRKGKKIPVRIYLNRLLLPGESRKEVIKETTDQRFDLKSHDSLQQEIARGSLLSFIVLNDHLKKIPPLEEVRWNGEGEWVEFNLVLDEEKALSVEHFKLVCFLNNKVPIGDFAFSIEIAAKGRLVGELAQVEPQNFRDYTLCFHTDDSDRIDTIKEDISGLEPDIRINEITTESEKDLAKDTIAQGQVFILVWSKKAQDSRLIEAYYKEALTVQTGSGSHMSVLVYLLDEGLEPPKELSYLLEYQVTRMYI